MVNDTVYLELYVYIICSGAIIIEYDILYTL